MADDVWAGIPVELREKVARFVDAAEDVPQGYDMKEYREAEANLCDALRSLLSRLQESEKDGKRLDFLMQLRGWPSRELIDDAMAGVPRVG